MSLLDRISGIAQKAKDNVVAKNIVSKDKRLEQNLSNNIKLNDFYFEKLSTYGLPSSVSLVAFDCVAGLLAVVDDSNYGVIKVFGKGISSTIRLPKPAGIKYIQFKTGDSILIVIDKANTIITINLRTKSVIHALPAQEIITTQTYCTGTDWLFIGYANGYVDVFDIVEGKMTPYQIPNLIEQENKSKNAIVVELQMHPTDLNTLLIGYESTVFIWSIRESTIRRSFSSRNLGTEANLTCLAWNPKGTRFIGGYDDGCIHVWDIKNDQNPALSYKLADIFPSPDHSEITEPVFQISWHANDASGKSFIFIAGGLNLTDIHGLNILEFDLEGESKEPKNQNIMPLPSDLSHFLILSTDPYYLGMHNPFGIAVVTTDHTLNVYSLDQGYPTLKLPPALEFINPKVLNACYIPQLPTTAFRRLAAITSNDRNVRYLPLTGGVAGPEHVYHIESNDLLLTIHQGEIIRFWDASYTALRPLTHLTIHCLDNLKNKDAFVCCLDINKIDGTLTVGFSDGSILVYEYQGDPVAKPDIDPKFAERNEKFISSCDETLKEISDLLEDMGTVSDTEEVHERSNTNPFLNDGDQPSTNPFANDPIQNTSSSTNSFLTSSSPPRPSTDSNRPPLPPRKQTPSCSFERLDSVVHSAGFYACLRVSINSPIRTIISTGESIVAAATEDGSVFVIDIHKQLALFSQNLANLDYQVSFAGPRTDVANEIEDIDHGDVQKPSITTLNFYNTYSTNKVSTASTQLFVGLSNGHIYQFSLSSLERGLTITPDTLIEYLSLHTMTSISELHIIDLHGETQIAIDTVKDEIKTPSISSADLDDKRSKLDYKNQENPHFVIGLSAHDISVFLAGVNVRLYHKRMNKDVTVVHSQVIKYNDVVCLSLLLNNGKVSLYTLPTLDFLLEMGLPNRCLLDRLQEASLCSDGRIVYWSGKYELEQYSFLHKPDFPIGESVILFDSYRTMPPHPSVQTQQPAKKSWLDSVAGAFQKDPFTVPEFDLLMGRVPKEDPNEVRRQRVEAYKAKMAKSNEGSSSKGPGGVFSQLGDKVNERGERLNELDKKFQDLNHASGDFLKAIKDYNERQARKKWWEF